MEYIVFTFEGKVHTCPVVISPPDNPRHYLCLFTEPDLFSLMGRNLCFRQQGEEDLRPVTLHDDRHRSLVEIIKHQVMQFSKAATHGLTINA